MHRAADSSCRARVANCRGDPAISGHLAVRNGRREFESLAAEIRIARPIDRHGKRCRNSGKISVQLIEQLLQQASDVYSYAVIRVWDENTPALSLYEKLGFKPIGAEIIQTKMRSEDETFEMKKLYLLKEVRQKRAKTGHLQTQGLAGKIRQ